MSARTLAAAACLVLGLGAAGCTGEQDQPASEPSPEQSATASNPTGQPEVCSALDELRTSVGELTDVPVDRSGLTALSEQLTEIRSDLQAVRESGSGEYAPQVDALDGALDGLQTSLQDATADPSSESLARVLQEIGSVGAAMRELAAALGDTC
jgi:hypothetical protein